MWLRKLTLIVMGLTGFLAGPQRAPGAPSASPDIDLVRLQAGYDNGPNRIRDGAGAAHLAQMVKRIADANPEFAALPVEVRVLREPLAYAFVLDNGAAYVSTGLIA